MIQETPLSSLRVQISIVLAYFQAIRGKAPR